MIAGRVCALGFSWRKRALLRQFSGCDGIRFLRSTDQVPEGATLLVWGSAQLQGTLAAAVRVVRVEDGFLRSIGLGADLHRPSSWVLDDTGIYYDATRPSALEKLLLAGGPSPQQLARARAFRERIVATGLTKYNLAAPRWQRPAGAQAVVLVAGQVETDASLQLGGAAVRSNLALVQAARQARPDAHLLYKPHPDVVAGLRAPGLGEEQVARHCDEVLREGSVHELLGQVDEVHVMTSLIGFEALLRGTPVVCHGWPFYAGFGLTTDIHPHPRRQRAVSLDALVGAALLDYPSYVSHLSGERCTPEQALDELLALRARKPHGVAPWRRWVRPLLARP